MVVPKVLGGVWVSMSEKLGGDKELKRWESLGFSPWVGRMVRRYISAIPLLMALALVLSLWLETRNPIAYARIQGGPTEEAFSGRLQALEEYEGVTLPLAFHQVMVKMGQGNHIYTTDEQGWVDLPLLSTRQGALQVSAWDWSEPLSSEQLERLLAGDISEEISNARRLLEGSFKLSKKTWQNLAHAPQRSFLLEQKKTCGPRQVRLSLSAPLAVPFQQEAKIEFLDLDPAEKKLRFSLQGRGVLLRRSADETASAAFNDLGVTELAFLLEPLQHQAQLLLVPQQIARRQGTLSDASVKTANSCQFFWNLPVLPGAAHVEELNEKSRGYKITTPLASEEVFFSLVSDSMRLGGGRLPLTPTRFGQAQGFVSRTLLQSWAQEIPLEQLTLLVSTDSQARSVGSLPYPLGSRQQVNVFQEPELISGRIRVLQEAHSQAKKRRVLLGTYLGSALLLFLYLYHRQLKAAETQLKRAFEHAGVDPGAAKTGSLSLTVILSALFFAFSLAVVWIIAR